MLNPGGGCFCLDTSKKSVNLPIRINQTNPILIELLRIDLETNQNETITLSAKQVKDLKRKADKSLPKSDTTSPRFLNFEVKRTGLYRLQKVVDESKLEVQRRLSDTLVVSCPKASISRSQVDKCKGELSNLSLQVEGMPPLKIKYSRIVNREDKGVSFQSIQPENLLSPFTGGQRTSGALISPADADVSWARAQSISVPLNESLSTSGTWFYSLNEVHDACGNVANYTMQNDDGEQVKSKGVNVEQTFVVHERPRASMSGCDPQHPLKIAKGRSALLPIQLGSTGRSAADIGHTLTYMFTPQEQLQANGEHAPDAKVEEISLKTPAQGSMVKDSGLYTLKSVSNQFCNGEVMEPASCLVLNPPEPDMAIKAEEIHDKCAGKSIGLTVDLDLLGTPPFDIRYEVTRKGDKHVQHKSVHVSRLRHQLHFTPQEAGHYTYRFKTIDDSVYKGVPLPKTFVLDQDVKPPASARLVTSSLRKKYCIEEPVSFDVRLQGEAPWTLEYELVHGGKRSKQKIKDIETELHTITTDNLVNGGEYALALASVQDKTGCKIFLEEEVKIDVRRQRPKASFGQLEGKRNTLTLEGIPVKLPLRLTGEAPWVLKYRNLNDTSQSLVYERRLYSSNGFLEVRDQGVFEIVDVQDNICPGTVDPAAKAFEVLWIPRPEVKISESALVELVGSKYVKKQVCEGDEDTLEVNLSGMSNEVVHATYCSPLTIPKVHPHII
jgi:nucleoporin POM152